MTTCFKAQNDDCKYGDALCWFSHDERNQIDNNETSSKDKKDVLQRIFEVMERMTERIAELEKTKPK